MAEAGAADAEQQEGYFERLHREAEPLRDATQPFTKKFMAKLKLLDLSESGHTDCNEVADCPEITICYLNTNAIRILEHANECTKLQKLDLHANKLTELPRAEFWSSLTQLEVLHLHTNNLQNLDDVKALAVLPKLTVLTMYRNPIALHPFYRSEIIKATLRGVSAQKATLRVLDHFALSLEEILGDVAQERGYRFGETFGAFSKNLRFKAPAPLTSRFVEHAEALKAESTSARALYLRYNPAAMIQRCYRGHRCRMLLWKTRAARKLQGITRGFLTRRRKALGLDPRKARATRMPAAFLKDVVWRLYFTADMEPVMRDLAWRAFSKNPAFDKSQHTSAEEAIKFTWSDFELIRPMDQVVPWQHTDDVTGVETSTKWVAGGLARRTRTDLAQITRQACKHLWLRLPNVTHGYKYGDNTGSGLMAAGRPTVLLGSEPAALARHFHSGLAAGLVGSQEEDATLEAGKPVGNRLLTWTAPNATVLMTLLDMVDLVNAGKREAFWPKLEGIEENAGLRVVSEYTIRRLAAVASIQACWRAHRARIVVPVPLQVRVRQERGRLALQRWWRWHLMTRRIAFLRDLHDIVSNINSSEVYLSEKHFERIDDVTLFNRRTLFPEQKRMVSLARADRINYVTQEGSPRQGLPRWTAAGSIAVLDPPEGESTRLLNPTNSQVVQFSAQMDEVCPAVRSTVFLSHHNYVRFVFQSVAEARARAAVLLVRSWKSVMGGSFAIRLMSRRTLERNGAASCIQSIFRGTKIRAAYVHHQRAQSRLSETMEMMSGDMVPGHDWAETGAPHPPIMGRSTGQDELGDEDELQVNGDLPVVYQWGDYEGRGTVDVGTGGITRDQLAYMAQQQRDLTLDAAREVNERDLSQLAHLQLNARKQWHAEKNRAKTAPARSPVPDDNLGETVRELREFMEQEAKEVAERVKADRAAAREQLNREKKASNIARVEKHLAEQTELAARREDNDVAEVRNIAAVRRRMRVTMNTQRGLGSDQVFAANFVRQNNAIGKQIGLSEYRRHRDDMQHYTLSGVRSRKMQSELRKQQNADLYTVRMVEQQRRVATDTIESQNLLAAERAAVLREETARRGRIRELRELRAQTSPEAIMAAQRQPFAVRQVVAKFVDESRLPEVQDAGASGGSGMGMTA
eukprot:COSAG06_NODE_282_length_18378_cov_85.787461_10_plen_1145_part_00